MINIKIPKSKATPSMSGKTIDPGSNRPFEGSQADLSPKRTLVSESGSGSPRSIRSPKTKLSEKERPQEEPVYPKD